MAAKKSSAATPPAKKAAGSKGKSAAPSGKSPAAKPAAVYSNPGLRERLKEKIKAGDKGGRPGQWSARKAQLLATEYKSEGGEYKKNTRTSQQKHLESWTEEKWQTRDGKKAQQGKTTARYLPKKAWDKLTPAQKKATDTKKKTTSRTGKQFVANTPAAKKARASSQKSA